MKRLIIALALWPSVCFGQNLSQDEKEYNYPPFRNCGLVTRWASNAIPPECLQTANNVYFDEDLSVYRRRGYGEYNATPCTDEKAIKGMWNYNAVDGQRYIVLFSSQSFFWTKNQGDCNPIVGLDNLNASAEYECVQTLGQLWCVNGIDVPFSTTVSTFTLQPNIPMGTKIGTFRNRVMVADISGEPSRIRLSGEGDGTDWTLKIPGVSTSPSSISISGLENGKKVIALMGQYQNAYHIGLEDELWALSGNDRRDFVLRQISSQIGVKDSRSVREKDNCLVWLSNRGIERRCGTTTERASDPVRTIIDGVIRSAGNTRSKTYDTQAEWETGLYQTQLPNQGPTSTTIYPGSVVPSTWGHVNTEASDWNNGTLINIDSTTIDGSILIGKSTTTSRLFADFSYGVLTSTWTQTSISPFGGCSIVSNSAKCTYSIGIFANIDNGEFYGVYDTTISWTTPGVSFSASNAVIRDFTITSNSYGPIYSLKNGYSYSFSSVGTSAGISKFKNGSSLGQTSCSNTGLSYSSPIYARLVINKSGIISYFINNTLVCSMTDTEYSSAPYFGVGIGYGGGVDTISFDNIKFPEYSNSSNWVSPVFDTYLSTPIGGPYYFDEYVPVGSTVTYQVRESSTTTLPTWSDWVNVSTTTSGEFRVPLIKRYWQEKISLETSYSTQTPVVNMTYLEATTTGYYIGDCINSSGITSWGNFRPNSILTGGSNISYAINGGSSCNQVTRSTATWITQNANAPISTSTSNYLGVRVFETPVTTTDTLRLDGLTVEWNEGSERPPVASAVYRDRYYMFYTTNTAAGSVNDKAVVLDMNNIWSTIDDVYAYSAVIYDNQLYTGDSRDTGHMHLQDIGIDDDGSSFSFHIKTSDYDFGNPVEKKKLKRVYLMLKSEEVTGQNIDINVKYSINGSTTQYTLNSVDLNEAVETGYFVAKFPAINEQASTFNWINFDISYDGTQGPINLYGIKAIYSPIRME